MGAVARKPRKPKPPELVIHEPRIIDPPQILAPLPKVEVRGVPAEEEKGLRCPKCHCRDLRVSDSRPANNGRIRRVRWCRHCGHGPMTSFEKLAFY